ncbi:MAG: hypothetical protein M3169_05450 [Candidatus Eremiobacteraeota bacterium]|nr:hypothetical protein [Candidatus Eremiobacteraeota bacterium]
MLGTALAFGAGVVASGASLGSASAGDDALAADGRSGTTGAGVAGDDGTAATSCALWRDAAPWRARELVSPRRINAIAMITTADASSNAMTGDLERRERRRARRRFMTGVFDELVRDLRIAVRDVRCEEEGSQMLTRDRTQVSYCGGRAMIGWPGITSSAYRLYRPK